MTFSIIACDRRTGLLGVATATHAYGVGPVANHLRPGVGAVATQAFVEISYGPEGLDLMEHGASAAHALRELVARDSHQEIRQVAYVSASGEVAYHTGTHCVPSSGSAVDDSAIAIGNMLANDRVLPEMLEAFQRCRGDFADSLLAALDAGESAGGDVRGRMSASLNVVTTHPQPHRPWEGVIHDLRVDFDSNPLQRLRTNLAVSRGYAIFFDSVFAPGLVTGDEPIRGAALDDALAGLSATQHLLGKDLEPTLWKGVLLARAGRTDQAHALLREAIANRPEFATFVAALHQAGVLPDGFAEATPTKESVQS